MIIIGLFAVAGVAFLVVEVLARRPGSTIPTFGDLTAAILRFEVSRIPVGRIGVYGFWWWVGWHFFAR
ncbi:DUF6186 family protein [Luedemannella helvata]